MSVRRVVVFILLLSIGTIIYRKLTYQKSTTSRILLRSEPHTSSVLLDAKLESNQGKNENSFVFVEQSMRLYLSRNIRIKGDIQKFNLIVYHVGQLHAKDSLDVAINNMKIFTSAIRNETITENQQQHAFYLFNVIGQENALKQFIPLSNNVAVIQWEKAISDMTTHIRTINKLSDDIIHSFSSLIFLNQGVRGPLIARKNNEWIQEFRSLLDHNNVGIVGSTMSCQYSPHIQTHIFMIRTSLFKQSFALIEKQVSPKKSSSTWVTSPWLEIIAKFELGLSTAIQQQGYNISSILYAKRMKQSYFNGQCISLKDRTENQENPVTWCDLTANDVIFMKWGGEPLRIVGLVCENTQKIMSHTLLNLQYNEPELNLRIPEASIGGRLYDLYREYAYETNMTQRYSNQKPTHLQLTSSVKQYQQQQQQNENVCLLVRVYNKVTEDGTIYIRYDHQTLIESLLRQTDPNWIAYFFNTDQREMGAEFVQLIRTLNDSRIVYLELPKPFRPKYTTVDAGYSATDYVLNIVLKHSQCTWISGTNGDNVYGTEVIHRILTKGRVMANSHDLTVDRVDMMLVPTDSRNFAFQDYSERGEVNHPDKHCIGILASITRNRLAYVVQPIPQLGKVDLASVFLNRERLAYEQITFNKFKGQGCEGCQDGLLTQYLVRNRLWNYIRLPIDGLKSIIFHGPSPTLCIASGNVWLHHLNPLLVGCVSHHTVRALKYSPGHTKIFDWKHFYSEFNDRVCLRMVLRRNSTLALPLLKSTNNVL